MPVRVSPPATDDPAGRRRPTSRLPRTEGGPATGLLGPQDRAPGPTTPPAYRIGTFLVREGLVTQQDIDEALEIQQRSGGRLGEILHADFGIKPLAFYKALARYFDFPFVDLTRLKVDRTLLHEADRPFYASQLVLPIRRRTGQVVVATANPCEEVFRSIHSLWGEDAQVVVTTKFDIFSTLQQVFAVNYSHEILSELYDMDSSKSAFRTFTRPQMAFATAVILAFSLLLYLSYPLGMTVFNSVLTISVSVVLLYKLVLSAIGYRIPVPDQADVPDIDEHDLPIYTILVPMLREKRTTIEHLARNLQSLEYPLHKLDIKLVLEADDLQTIEIVKELALPAYFEIVRVPPSEPRTKPKACNYALKFARGDYVTIYDAEDRPDPDQLKRAIATFRQGDERLACVQCALNYFNGDENWLTRMFTIEYTYWFDLMLPALSRLNLPIPLGGTSNHFRTEVLREMIAWDPFNVTEDADLGIRMNRLKYHTQAITSTTYEEANCRISNWIRQRTRWLKGYMQTYLVHMREPVKLYRELGPRGFLSFQLFIGGNVLSNMANVVLIVIFVAGVVLGSDQVSVLFPHPTIEIAWLNLIAGNVLLLLLNLLAVWRRRLHSLLPFVATVPFYWLLASVAAYRAMYQLFFHPSQWEKTEHGISKYFLTK
jgi:glycosyltransferase XagB